MVDKSKVEFTKAGIMKRMESGAIPMAQTLLTDPMAFADQLEAKFREKGVDTKDFKKVNEQLYAMIGNRTSSGALSQMINYRASLDKEAKNYERVPGIGETYKTLFESQSPLATFLDAQAKWIDAQARVGKPVAEQGGVLAGYASDLMLNHPDMAAGLAKLPEPAEKAAASLLSVYDPATRLGGSLGQAQGAAVSFAARLNGLDLRTSFTLPVLPNNSLGQGTPKPGIPQPPGFYFNPPKSAVGSIVRSDGLVSVHKGNTIFPAALSRRAPGDWLDAATVNNNVQVNERWRDDEFAGAPDYSSFGDSGAAGDTYHIGNIVIQVPPGSPAAEDPQELARVFMRKLEELRGMIDQLQRGLPPGPDDSGEETEPSGELPVM